MDNIKVVVLLATYNGEKYIKEQLDSIIAQTYQDFIVYISDDGSHDGTLEILNNYSNNYSNKIVLVKSSNTKHGAKQNFIHLLHAVDSDIFLFSDQDDVWDKQHIESLVKCYATLQTKEKKLPVLIHSDLKIVDAQLNTICRSIFNFNQMPKIASGAYNYFVQNNVTGCSMLINNALKTILFKNEFLMNENLDVLPMHDHLFACIASVLGNIIFVDKVTVNYRQHNDNVVGAKNTKTIGYNLKKILSIHEQKKIIISQKSFVAFFVDYFKSDLNSEQIKILNSFVRLNDHIKLYRIFFLVRYGFLRYGLKRILLQLLFI